MPNFRIVALGDSIVWGQGLLDNEKFVTLVRQGLLPKHAEGVTLGPVSSFHPGRNRTRPGTRMFDAWS